MKEKFIKSTIILIIGGIITKILGMLNKVIMARYLGTEGLGIYMMILPSFILFLNISSFGFPVAVSKLVSEDDRNNKKLIFTSIIFVLFINFLLMIFILFIAKYLSFNLLHEKRSYYAIMAISLVIPFASISGILRSYFFGRERMGPHVISHITEDIVRIIAMVIGVPFFMHKGVEYAVCFVILTNIISEVTSILILFFFLPKNFSLTRSDVKPSKIYLRDCLSISIPTTATRLIGSICYFLEPIILTGVLLYVGYPNSVIVREYGIISGYALPLILLPSFFSNAISQALLPVITKKYKMRDIAGVKRKIRQGIAYSLLIGIPLTIVLEMFPDKLLKLLYNTTSGVSYIRFLAPVCLLQYIQAPLASTLDALGMSKENFTSNLAGVLTRLVMLPLFSLIKIGMWGLIFSTSLNVVVVTMMNIKQVRKKLE
ncbi:MAG: oligosaccharide flippase family protein [Clostridium sp.]|nr:oligosaccharide flippase family protein [Clostridium sp.]